MQRLAIISLMLLLLWPSYAQEGKGSIREGITDNLRDIGSLNPLRCDNEACNWAVSRIFPTLLAFNPESRWLDAGTSSNGGLAESWELSADNLIYTFHLREDAFWSDGQPMSAYDYFYSYLAIISRDFDSPYYNNLRANLLGVVPLGEKDLAIILRENNCDALWQIRFPIAPAHVFDSDFAETAAAAFTGEDIRAEWEAWNDSFAYDFAFMNDTDFDFEPSVTGGIFDFVRYQPYEYIRLQAGDVALELVPVPSSDEEVNMFLNGELTLLTNPPSNRWADIQAAPDVQVSQMPTGDWDYLAFNFEDPVEPESAFDEDGNPIAQEQNPYFSDIRVRQAIQAAINVPELIEVGLQGQGTALAGVFSPYAYPYDSSLSPVVYDPEKARDLLDDAGWILEGNTRRCVDCAVADFGTYLNLDLAYGSAPHHYQVAMLLAQQLFEVGIYLNIYQSDVEDVMRQNFDMYLASAGAPYSAISLNQRFEPAADVLGTGWNFISYQNEVLSSELEAAQTLAGCGLEERISHYQAAQNIINAELPYIALYAQDSRVAVQGNVQNFVPTVGSPLGDLRTWS